MQSKKDDDWSVSFVKQRVTIKVLGRGHSIRASFFVSVKRAVSIEERGRLTKIRGETRQVESIVTPSVVLTPDNDASRDMSRRT